MMNMYNGKRKAASKKKLDGARKLFGSISNNYLKMAVPRVKKRK